MVGFHDVQYTHREEWFFLVSCLWVSLGSSLSSAGVIRGFFSLYIPWGWFVAKLAAISPNPGSCLSLMGPDEEEESSENVGRC